MNYFISCDWGTSSLRLRLVDTSTKTVLKEITSDNGIATTYKLWNESKEKKSDRLTFYIAVLKEQIQNLEQQTNTFLDNSPLIISGMASSSIGMLELSYKEIPFKSDGSDLEVKIINGTESFDRNILLISGAKADDDAMRGEETQLIGCIEDDNIKEQFFILPGTHSKHVWVNNGKVVAIKTFMTGEFFKLLSTQSILAGSVIRPEGFPNKDHLVSFKKGVAESLSSNLLNSSFKVRTNELFGKLTKEENYYYLSGLVIGSELSELANVKIQVAIVGDELQSKLYNSTLQSMEVQQIKFYDAIKATVNGHIKMYNLYKQELNKATNPINQQSTT